MSPHTGKAAKINDSSTWGSFQDALECCARHQFEGIGFVFADTDPFVGIDLDECIDDATGEISSEAAAIVERFGSYTEISPSGKGLHIIVEGHLTEGGRKKDGIEIYDRGRFFTVTGKLLKACLHQIEYRQNIVDSFYQENFLAPTGG